MLIPGWPGGNLGLREFIIAMIVLVAIYIVVVLWRMRRLHRAAPVGSGPAPQPVAESDALISERTQDEPPETFEGLGQSVKMAEQALQLGLEQEVAQMRDELDAVRGELAALRQDMQHELAQLRAAQSVSPIYGDAMQLAAAGYDPLAIAERCGIARAEAELVVALSKSREQ